MEEEWKLVEGFSMYEVSSFGQVRDSRTKELRPLVLNGGFLCTNMYDDAGKKVLCKVHRMVALTFVPKTEGVGTKVEHEDGDKTNNHYLNLRYNILKQKEVKEAVKYHHCGFEYTVEELSSLSNQPLPKVKAQLKKDWKIREILTQIKEFTGSGFQNDTHWFPTKTGLQIHETEVRRVDRLNKVEAYLKEKQRLKEERQKGFYSGLGVNDMGSEYPYMLGKWSGMIYRVYSPNAHKKAPTYIGCSVSERWLRRSGFKDWFLDNYIEGWQLDKDLLVPGNKIYSEETCCFVPAYINSLLWDSTVKTKYMHGVSFGATFNVKVGRNGETIEFKGFEDEMTAHLKWQEEKIISIGMAIDRYREEPKWDQRVVDCLLLRVGIIEEHLRDRRELKYLL